MRMRQTSANGITSFVDPAIMRPPEVQFRQQDTKHSLAERQPQVLKQKDSMAILLEGANFWAYSMLIKCSCFASHRFIPHISALRFPPFGTPRETEEARQLMLEGLQLLKQSSPVGMVTFSEEMKFFEHMLRLSDRPEEVVRTFFGGDGFKLGEIQEAFMATLPVLGMRGIVQKSSMRTHRGENKIIEKHDRFYSERSERERARQLEKGRLMNCSLPSCSEIEKSTGQHKLCSRCRTVRYCCVDHQRQDWKAHKLQCVPKDPKPKP